MSLTDTKTVSIKFDRNWLSSFREKARTRMQQTDSLIDREIPIYTTNICLGGYNYSSLSDILIHYQKKLWKLQATI